MRERVAVVLDGHAAARRVHHDGLDRAGVGEARHPGPPGVDVAAHVVEATVVVAAVAPHRAAAAGGVGHDRLHAGEVEHARRRGVDVGPHRVNVLMSALPLL